MSARRCLFCSSTKLTREHVWPKWVVNLFDQRWPKDQRTHLPVRRTTVKGTQFWNTNTIEVTSHLVCAECNNGWMSEIEGHAKDVLSPFIADGGSRRIATVEDQCTIAIWVALRAMVFDALVMEAEPYFRKAERRAFAAGADFVPKNMNLWLAPYLAEGSRRAYFDVVNQIGRDSTGRIYRRASVMTCAIGEVAIKSHMWDGLEHILNFERLRQDGW